MTDQPRQYYLIIDLYPDSLQEASSIQAKSMATIASIDNTAARACILPRVSKMAIKISFEIDQNSIKQCALQLDGVQRNNRKDIERTQGLCFRDEVRDYNPCGIRAMHIQET